MPRVQIYDNNVVPLPQTTGARFVAADNNGGVAGAIGAGLQGVGKALDQRADVLAETHAHEEAAASGLELQQVLQSTDTLEQAYQAGKVEGAPASGAGLQEAVLGHYDEQVGALVGQIQNKDVRGRVQAQAAEYRRNYASRTYHAEEAALGAYFADQNSETTALAANRLRESNDPADLSASLTDLRDIIASYSVAGDKKSALTKWTEATLTRSFLDGQIERDPHNALALLDQGVGAKLDPNIVDQLRDEAHAAIRSQEAQARAEASHQTAVQKDRLGAIEQGLEAGGGTAQDRFAVAQQYAQLGDQSKAAEWQRKGLEFGVVQGTKDWTIPQMDATIVQLIAKQGGKEGLTAAEAAQLNGLRAQRAQSAARLNQPGGALLQLQYATGKPVAPLDYRNPATLRQRANDATAAAQTYGRGIVEPLLPEEVKPLQDLLAKGDVASRAQALRIITAFGSPAAIRGAAGQITGDGDGAFKVAATRSLGPAGSSVAMHILGGPDALKANPGVWQAANPNDPTKLVPAEDPARAIFNEYIPALAGLGPDAANDTYEAAKDYYASKMTAAGKTQFNADTWRQAVDTVIGGYNQDGQGYRGGTAMFQGQHRVVIPEGWTGEGLFRRFARATGDDWAKAGGGHDPVWPDGSKVYSGQLSQLVPVWVGGTSYVFRSPKTGNFLGTRAGQPFRIDAAKVPWR